ncbi:hypothetical protein HMPREF3034_00933 [Prevotella sp. DNF00663]|nr:hypothetical protein HMPREF3034_00933 [Prevotella sp. DNF00663]
MSPLAIYNFKSLAISLNKVMKSAAVQTDGTVGQMSLCFLFMLYI